MKKLNKQEFGQAVVFFSLFGMLVIALIMWWIEFVKYNPQIIF